MKLREGELIQAEAHIHPIFHRTAFMRAVFITLIMMLVGSAPTTPMSGTLLMAFLIGWVSSGILYFFFKRTKYLVTNQRLYLSSGILSHNIREDPLAIINDVSLRRGLSDRICGTGTILILTGNERGILLRNIEASTPFMGSVSLLINSPPRHQR